MSAASTLAMVEALAREPNGRVGFLVVDVRTAYDRHMEFVPAPFVPAPLIFAPLLLAASPAVVRLRWGAGDAERDDASGGQNESYAAHLILLLNNARLRVSNGTIAFRLISPVALGGASTRF
jgi:hypothetical protein